MSCFTSRFHGAYLRSCKVTALFARTAVPFPSRYALETHETRSLATRGTHGLTVSMAPLAIGAHWRALALDGLLLVRFGARRLLVRFGTCRLVWPLRFLVRFGARRLSWCVGLLGPFGSWYALVFVGLFVLALWLHEALYSSGLQSILPDLGPSFDELIWITSAPLPSVWAANGVDGRWSGGVRVRP